LLVKLASFPGWDSPWMLKRGRYSYLRNGELHQNLGFGYDMVYDLMSAEEAGAVRAALLKSAVQGAFRTYVQHDMITCDTSNWISHVIGGALICATAIYGDDPGSDSLEPYLSGAVFKYYDFISSTFTPGESYGEGMGYYNTAMRGLARAHPSIDRVFNIDFTLFMEGSYQEVIWGGIISDKRYFHYGDSGNYPSLERWAWLLGKRREPLLGWFYNYMKRGEDFVDVLFETSDVLKEEPYSREPVRAFRRTGTTVFKSGWGKDDFVFVLRSGPFVNHQHLDQGSFWLADRGVTFIEERHGSSYYDDVLYQSRYTQPIGHSTILVDGNHQSQRTGDPLVFAEGFEDYARITHFLNGEFAAFSTGDIGRLYWGKVKGLERNVLYLKPRTLLMLDTAYPAERDADVTLLYQTAFLNDINDARDGKGISTITKDGVTLHVMHLAPEHPKVAAVETPHYLRTLREETPLEREGMLTVTVRTNGVPLVVANLLTTTTGGAPDANYTPGEGFVTGKAGGTDFAFSTRPGILYTAGGVTTDAAAVTWKDGKVFAARCTHLSRDGKTLLKSGAPVTCEVSGNTAKFYHCAPGMVSFGASAKPSRVTVNGAASDYSWDNEKRLATVNLPAGEGIVGW
ncbi:MAG: heparinase II/III domain-containing protein, partial [Candidatus Latescibacterota bacterium]